MIIMHRSTPSSLLKAAVLSRLHKGFCIHADDLSKSILNDELIDCDQQSIDTVINHYIAKYGPLTWFKGPKARSLAQATYYAGRHKSTDKYRLIISVLQQALQYGPDYVLSRVSSESRQMFNRSRRVCMEIHRAYGFVRTQPVDTANGPVMVGKAKFEHDIYDIVIQYFNRRHKIPLYLISEDQVYYLHERCLKITNINELYFKIPEDEFTPLWEAYYDSQSIESRKNLALARKHLPKKYWSWVAEGEKLK